MNEKKQYKRIIKNILSAFIRVEGHIVKGNQRLATVGRQIARGLIPHTNKNTKTEGVLHKNVGCFLSCIPGLKNKNECSIIISLPLEEEPPENC